MGRIHKIVLVNYVANKSKTVDSGLYPHLSTKSLFSYLRKQQLDGELNSEVHIEEIDGDVLKEEDLNLTILSHVGEGTLFGFYTAINNYRDVEEISIKIKAQCPNCIIILGGPWATYLPDQIIYTNSSLDGLVVGDGEIPLFGIVRGDDWSEIKGLYYRKDDKIYIPQRGKISWVSINKMPYPLQFLDTLDPYIKKQRERFPNSNEVSAATYFSRGSCTGKCIFCCIHDKKGRDRDYEDAWREVMLYRENYGVNHIFNVSENTSNEWLTGFSRLYKKYNRNNEVTFKFFASADIITDDFIKKYVDMGGRRLFIGFESNSEKILRTGKKGRTTPQDNMRALKLIQDHDLDLEAGFVFGLPGEDDSTLSETRSFAEKCMMYPNTKLLLASLVVPLPGSLLWKKYIQANEENRRKYIYDEETDQYRRPIFRISEIQEDYMRTCKEVTVSLKKVRQLQKDMLREVPGAFECWEMHEGGNPFDE